MSQPSSGTNDKRLSVNLLSSKYQGKFSEMLVYPLANFLNWMGLGIIFTWPLKLPCLPSPSCEVRVLRVPVKMYCCKATVRNGGKIHTPPWLKLLLQHAMPSGPNYMPQKRKVQKMLSTLDASEPIWFCCHTPNMKRPTNKCLIYQWASHRSFMRTKSCMAFRSLKWIACTLHSFPCIGYY